MPATSRARLITGLGLLILILMGVTALGCSREDGLSDIERQAQAINSTVMCPVCPGESIDQSQNPLAARMRGIVMDRLEQGWTEEQIKDHFVESYGDSVLLAPPSHGFSLLVWILPPVGVASAIAAVFLVMRNMRRGEESAEALESTELEDGELQEYATRVERVLAEHDAD